MDAVGDRMFRENNPFEAVMGRKDLNGLEKLREMVRVNQSDRARQDMNIQSMPILKNPRVLAGMIEANRKELAELIPLLTSLWLAPTVFPSTSEGMLKKFRFIREMLEKMGMPVIDDEIMKMAEEYFREIEDSMKEAEAFQDAGREPGGR